MAFEFFKNFVPGRKGEILDAAIQIFMDKGYANGSMRDIARLTGVSEPALYRHYNGKEDLFNQLIIKTSEKLVSEAYQLIENIDPAQIKWSIQNIFNDRQNASKSYFPILRSVFLECFHHPVFMQTYQEKLTQPMLRKLYQVIPIIDAFYGQKYDQAENRKRIRIFLSIFSGYLLTSIIFSENDSLAIAETVIKTMEWQDNDKQNMEDSFLTELPADFNIIKRAELQKKIAQPKSSEHLVILDLRGKEAFTKDHIPGSTQILIKELPSKYGQILTDKITEIIVVCSGGMQSLYAVMYLQMKGYTNVKSLGGGFSKWNME